jgi:hypothetical protein
MEDQVQYKTLTLSTDDLEWMRILLNEAYSANMKTGYKTFARHADQLIGEINKVHPLSSV